MTLANLQYADAWQNTTIASMQTSINSLSHEVTLVEDTIQSNTLVDTDLAEVHDLQQTFTQLNATMFDLASNFNATDYERRISILEDEEVVNSGAIANNAVEIKWNAANITLLNETIQNGTVAGNLTDQVNNNTAAIANLTDEFSAVVSWNVTGVDELTKKVDANTESIS